MDSDSLYGARVDVPEPCGRVTVGRAGEGEREHLKNQIKKKLEKNLSEEQIAEMLETDIAEVKQIMNEIQNKE